MRDALSAVTRLNECERPEPRRARARAVVRRARALPGTGHEVGRGRADRGLRRRTCTPLDRSGDDGRQAGERNASALAAALLAPESGVIRSFVCVSLDLTRGRAV